MQKSNTDSYRFPSADSAIADTLAEVLQRGARQMLIQAVEADAAGWIDDHAHVTDDQGRRQVVRNGHAVARKIVTGVGELEVQMPRVHEHHPPIHRMVKPPPPWPQPSSPWS